MGETFTIRNLADIEAIEKVPFAERVTESNTYELISKGAAINPAAIAMSFIADGEAFQSPQRVTYGEFIAKIRQTANMLADMGVGPQDVVTYLLPNLPQTHFVLWGAETVGIANPINPMLEADTIKEICQAAGTKVLVALGDLPGVDIWPKVEAIRKEIPSLEKVVRVMGPSDEAEGIVGFEETVGALCRRPLDVRSRHPTRRYRIALSHRRYHGPAQIGQAQPFQRSGVDMGSQGRHRAAAGRSRNGRAAPLPLQWYMCHRSASLCIGW